MLIIDNHHAQRQVDLKVPSRTVGEWCEHILSISRAAVQLIRGSICAERVSPTGMRTSLVHM